MNKTILMGRLTRDPEQKYTQGEEPIAVTRISVAVNRRFKREGEPEADFINCVSFGKTAEFISKYFNKGKMIAIVGRIQTGSYTDSNGNKKYTFDIVVEEANFCGGKEDTATQPVQDTDEFYTVDDNIDDNNLPF